MNRLAFLLTLCLTMVAAFVISTGADDQPTDVGSEGDSVGPERRMFEFLRDSTEWENGFDSLEAEEQVRFLFHHPRAHTPWPDTNYDGSPVGLLSWDLYRRSYLNLILPSSGPESDSVSFVELLLSQVKYDYHGADSAKIATEFAYRLSKLTEGFYPAGEDSLTFYQVLELDLDKLLSLANSAQEGDWHSEARFFWRMAGSRLRHKEDSSSIELSSQIDSILGITRHSWPSMDYGSIEDYESWSDSTRRVDDSIRDVSIVYADDDATVTWYGYPPSEFTLDWEINTGSGQFRQFRPWETFRFKFLLATYYTDEPVNDSVSLAETIRSDLGWPSASADSQAIDSILSTRMIFLGAKPYRAGSIRVTFFDLLGLEVDSLLRLAELAQEAGHRGSVATYLQLAKAKAYQVEPYRFQGLHRMIDSLISMTRGYNRAFVRELQNFRDSDDTAGELAEISSFIDTVGYMISGFTVRQSHERAVALHLAIGDTTGAIEQLLSTPRSSGGHLISDTAEVDMFREALDLAIQLKDSSIQLMVMDTMLSLYFWTNIVNNRDSSLFYYKKCHDYAVALGDRRREARYIFALANYKDPYEERDTVAADYLRSAAIRHEIGDTSGVAYMYHGLGRIWSQNDELDSALHYYNRSLDRFRSIGDTVLTAYTLEALGVQYHQQKKFETADSAFRKSINLQPEGGKQYLRVATSLQSLGDFEGAIAYLKEGIDSSAGEYILEWLYRSLAECYSHLGQEEEFWAALQKYQKHMFYGNAEDSAYVVRSIVTPVIADHYSRHGHVDSAVSLLEPILKQQQDSGTAIWQSVAWARIGHVYRENELYHEAIEAFAEALVLSYESRSGLTDFYSVSCALASCHMEMGEFAKARQLLEDALADADQYHKYQARQLILGLIARLEKLEKGDTTGAVD